MKKQNLISGNCKGLLLYSGGLDSNIAYFILKNQGIDVFALIFRTPFFEEEEVVRIANANGINHRVIDLSDDYIEKVLKHPKYGYGKNLNPCIDCHAFMLSKAKEIMKKEGYDFIATGEVINQRPMSQNKQALKLIEDYIDLKGRILRPLSAQLLEETVVEKSGCVNRNKLLKISGRSRKEQILLAKRFHISSFKSPAGGCLLTDPAYAKRAKMVLELFDKPLPQYFDMIKFGRIFIIEGKLLIIGRNKNDNEQLKKYKKYGIILESENVPGPTAIFINKDKNIPKPVFNLIASYSDGEDQQKITIKFDENKKIDIIKDKAMRGEYENSRI